MKKIIISSLALVPFLMFGQLDRSIRPEAGKAPKINIKDSEVFTTKNGITVILSENHKLPKVSFNLVTASDQRVEGNLAGLSEVAGSLINSGTTNRTKDELDKEIDFIGAYLSAGSNNVYLSCLTKHVDKGLNLMTDILMNANFPQSEVDRIIKQNEASLLALKSEPSGIASNVEDIANFGAKHPYGEVMTEESLKNINRSAIVNYYKSTFSPKGSHLVIVGDVTRQQAEELVDKYFSSWAGVEPYRSTVQGAKRSVGNRVVFVKKPGAVQSVVRIAFPVDLAPGDEDYLKVRVLNGILGASGFGARLMQNLREDKAYTYGCYSSVDVDDLGSVFTSGGNFRNEVTDSAITQILFEIDRITKENVTDKELALTKSSMAGSFARSMERPSTIARFARSIIKNKLPKDYYQTYLERLDKITKEDILAVAKKYLTANNCNIIVVGSEDVLDNLKQFDSDGKIEKWDAFGNEAKDMKPSDLTADQVFEKYVTAVTKNLSAKKLAKLLKKTKTMIEEAEVTIPGAPAPLKSTNFFQAPNGQATRLEMNGMTIQSTYFDGKTGTSTNMQTGSKEMTEKEIAASNKNVGLIPEMNYKTSGMEYEVLGIEEKDGKEFYVVEMNDGSATKMNYYDKNTGLLSITSVVRTDEASGQTQEITTIYTKYSIVNGLLFPSEYTLNVGPMNISAKVINREMNPKKMSLEDFK